MQMIIKTRAERGEAAPRARVGLGLAGAGADKRSGVPGRIGGAVGRASIYPHKG